MATIPEALAIAVQHHQAGRLQAGEQIYRQILAIEPNHANALHLLGVIAYQVGKLDAAVEDIRRAIGLNGNVAAFHSNLGNALKDQGKLDEAVASYRRAVELKPNLADAHNNLGVALMAQRKLDEAVACYRRALELKSDYAMAHNNLGCAFMDQRKLDEAVACYRRALELKPDYAEAHNNLGNALKDQAKLEEAVACYRRALELKPDYAEAHNNLGNALKDQGNLEEAIACCRRALALQAGFADAYNNLGVALNNQGKPEEAVACYRRALELKPDFVEAHYNLGGLWQEQGKLEEATKCYREAVACAKRVLQSGRWSPEVRKSLGDAFGQLAMIFGSRLPEDDLMAMRQFLSEPNVSGDSRTALEFGLAWVLDGTGNYDDAGEHLRQANALRSVQLRARNQEYQPAYYRGFVDALITTLTPQRFARTNGFGLETELPVFIFGLPRSGTTLTEQILASHWQVFGAGELIYCRDVFKSLPKAMLRADPPLECLRDLDRKTARDLAQRHVDRLQALNHEALRIVDKMPENYHYLGLISILFPKARLIHCRRDLRDVALSCWMTNFVEVPWAFNPDHIASRFEDYRRMMDHWQAVLPVPLLNVDYEEMVEDLEGTARRIVAWCGLEWEPACLKFHETQRPVRTASAVQVRQPIYKTSVGRWKNYEKSLGELFARVERLNWRK